MRGVTYITVMEIVSIFISTHTPHARRDRTVKHPVEFFKIFQLTRLMRGVTLSRLQAIIP